MKQYKVVITEILEKVVTVRANSKDKAIDKVTGLYYDGKIILDADDFVCNSIDIKEDA